MSKRWCLITVIALLAISCSPTKPDNGTLHVLVTAVGQWPEDVSLRIKVNTREEDPLAETLVSEATAWGDDSVREAHAVRGDSTVVEASFTLIAATYEVSVWALTPWRLPYETQLHWFGRTVKVRERQTSEISFRVDFADINPLPQ